jgi:hypothetical protein
MYEDKLPISVKEHQQKSYEQSSKMYEDKLPISVKSPSHNTDDIQVDHKIKSNVKHSTVSDIENNKSSSMDLISTVLRSGQPFTDSKLNNPGYSTDEPLNECETISAMNMTRYKNLFHLIPLFLEKNVIVTEKMIYQAELLACLLVGLATCVFEIPINTMHLFHDIDGSENIYDDYCFLYDEYYLFFR